VFVSLFVERGEGGGDESCKKPNYEKKIVSIAFVMGSIPINENGIPNTPHPRYTQECTRGLTRGAPLPHPLPPLREKSESEQQMAVASFVSTCMNTRGSAGYEETNGFLQVTAAFNPR
jgi:hypothetical protein